MFNSNSTLIKSDFLKKQNSDKLMEVLSEEGFEAQFNGYSRFLFFKQVHGNDIKIFTDKKKVNEHLISLTDQEFDGGFLGCPGTLLIRTADCYPVQFIQDSKKSKLKNWVAQLHCGWRSTQKEIVNKLFMLVDQLSENNYDNERTTMKIKIGPGICEKCYIVGQDLVDAFAEQVTKSEKDAYFVPSKTKNNKYYFNLKKLLVKKITDNRISLNQIEVTEDCTFCTLGSDGTSSYHSFRRDQDIKRNLNLISILSQ